MDARQRGNWGDKNAVRVLLSCCCFPCAEVLPVIESVRVLRENSRVERSFTISRHGNQESAMKHPLSSSGSYINIVSRDFWFVMSVCLACFPPRHHHWISLSQTYLKHKRWWANCQTTQLKFWQRFWHREWQKWRTRFDNLSQQENQRKDQNFLKFLKAKISVLVLQCCRRAKEKIAFSWTVHIFSVLKKQKSNHRWNRALQK